MSAECSDSAVSFGVISTVQLCASSRLMHKVIIDLRKDSVLKPQHFYSAVQGQTIEPTNTAIGPAPWFNVVRCASSTRAVTASCPLKEYNKVRCL